ncbi:MULTISPECIES: hypothetical protein [unclassified Streptomyces]|uniref:hypothetical protein n=1 Tax=unclassified Streptomyces TaxID=2593676 RepID=UPI003820BA3F
MLTVLPVEPGTVDRAKIDRDLMHVAEPACALAQLHLATGQERGSLWRSRTGAALTVDAEDPDIALAGTFLRFLHTHHRDLLPQTRENRHDPHAEVTDTIALVLGVTAASRHWPITPCPRLR